MIRSSILCERIAARTHAHFAQRNADFAHDTDARTESRVSSATYGWHITCVVVLYLSPSEPTMKSTSPVLSTATDQQLYQRTSQRTGNALWATLRDSLGVALLGIAAACSTSADESADAGDTADVDRPVGWGEATHSAGAEPDYDLLFNDDVIADMQVHRIDLVITQDVYDQTMQDLENVLGSACGQGGGPGGGGGGDFTDEDPVWVPIQVQHDGIEWTNVGMRYKGNSSLSGAWGACTKKLSFRLDFDQFEEEFPEIENQRFYGFKKMTFSNGYKDDSLIRDKLGADIFRRAGIPAARGAFSQVYATIGGSESVYLGLYAMIEDPSNKMLDSQFSDDDGNLYKPEATWANDTSSATLESEFEKKTNEENGDWSDIIGALDALHSSNRESDPAAWRATLEQYVNVDSFLRWYAVNQAMLNWDTYGCMAHNYYLYADASDPTDLAPEGRLTWFPWDLNESMLEGGRCRDSAELMPDASQIGDDWPLIRYLLDDDVYAQAYQAHLQSVTQSGGGLDADWVKQRIAGYNALISEFVVGPTATEGAGYTFLSSEAAFQSSVNVLQSHVDSRVQLVLDAIE